MNSFTANVVQAQNHNNGRHGGRIASLALAAVLTLAMLAGVNSLAVMDAPASVMAQGSSSTS